MAVGTTPRGANDEKEAADWVRNAFAAIAPKYDLLNHLLSFNIDRSWRKRLLRQLQPTLAQQNVKVLDLCCGTGDVLLELQGVTRSAIFGADFCHPMLVAAGRKIASKRLPSLLFEADALQLPLADNSLDGIAISFGFRNLTGYESGLKELCRVLKPGGTLAILEFSHPQNAIVRLGYRIYSNLILPWIGGAISGSRDAYTYLPDSIRKFPSAERLLTMLLQTPFRKAHFEMLTQGVAALHVATK